MVQERGRVGGLYKLGFALIVAFTAVAIFYPFYWMVIASIQPEGSSLANVSLLLPHGFSLSAYTAVLQRKPMLLWVFNTLLVTLAATALVVPLSLLAAYSLNRFRFRGRTGVIFFVLMTQLLPASALVVPLFLIFRNYRLLNTLHGVSIAYMSFLLPLAIWILWGYMQTIPAEFEEAAMVDGCDRLGAFLRVTVPLAVPGLAAVALFAFLESWNQYLLAYVLTSSENTWVVSLGLYSFIGEYVILVEQMMAASVIASIPALLVFVILQRYLRGGLALGGLRG